MTSTGPTLQLFQHPKYSSLRSLANSHLFNSPPQLLGTPEHMATRSHDCAFEFAAVGVDRDTSTSANAKYLQYYNVGKATFHYMNLRMCTRRNLFIEK